MKDRLYIKLLAIALLIFMGCKKDSFNYSLYKPVVDEIDSIYFSTGSTQLIADGKASLQFVVETYRKFPEGEPGSSGNAKAFVDYRELPAGSVKIFDANSGQEVGDTFSTTDLSSGTLRFYAQVGNTKSPTREVTLRAAQPLPARLTVDVVFHVFEQSPNDKYYDPFTYQPVTKEILEAAVKDLNDVFNNRLGNDANGASANMEFRLATVNASGQALDVPGLDVYTYDFTLMAQARAAYNLFDFTNYINRTPAFIWDPSRYFNIYVIPSGANVLMASPRAMYQVVPGGETPLPGMTVPPATITMNGVAVPLPNFTTYPNGVVPADLSLPVAYETAGLGIQRTLLFPGMGKRISICSPVGGYYGVYPTQGTAVYNDYCTDTRIYNNDDATKNSWTTITKTDVKGNKFLANNAMDDTRFPSLRNTFTQDQVNRIRWVIANSPLRNHGKPF